MAIPRLENDVERSSLDSESETDSQPIKQIKKSLFSRKQKKGLKNLWMPQKRSTVQTTQKCSTAYGLNVSLMAWAP